MSFIFSLICRWHQYLHIDFPGLSVAPGIPFGHVPPFSSLGGAGPIISAYPDFPGGPMGRWGPFFPIGVLLPRGPFAPVRPGYLGGLAGHIFSLDLQYLVGISCSICVVISFCTSCIVMVRSWSAVRNLSPVSWLSVCSWFPWLI